MTIFQKTMDQQPELKMEDASKILENVFKETNVEPNSVPLEVLTAYSNYRKERFSLQRMVIVIIMVLFLMLPILFVPATFTIQPDVAEEAMNPTYTLEVTSKMVVKRVTAEIGDRNVPVYEMDAHVYSIEPAINGRMKVTVTLANNQEAVQYVNVGNVDLESPVLTSTDVGNGVVKLYLSDAGSGINYANIFALNEAGETILPQNVDEATGCVTFAYPDGTLNVNIPDMADNKLQLVISLR